MSLVNPSIFDRFKALPANIKLILAAVAMIALIGGALFIMSKHDEVRLQREQAK